MSYTEQINFIEQEKSYLKDGLARDGLALNKAIILRRIKELKEDVEASEGSLDWMQTNAPKEYPEFATLIKAQKDLLNSLQEKEKKM